MKDTKSIIAIPLAIIVAGGLIAGAIFMTKNDSATISDTESKIREVKAVTSEDHIMGNPDAKLVVVEYSDTECPYCKNFHKTMQQIMQEHGTSGDVAWVYRHFPLDNLHKKARNEALATECAASLGGGNNAFWNYINRVFELTGSNDALDPKELYAIAKEQGIDEAKFTACMNEGALAEKVESDYQSGLDAGVEGTPYSIILVKGSQTVVPIDGAQPYSMVSNVINTLLNN